MSELVDLSHPLTPSTPPFPGDPPVEITVMDATDKNDRSERDHLNVSRLTTSIHCGTHMDAPFHFFAGRATIDQIPLETCIGPAVLIELAAGRSEQIGVDQLRPHAEDIRLARRVLINTGWHRQWGTPQYFTVHPVISGAAAALLVELGCTLLGVDLPSVDRPPYPAHLELLGNDVIIVENLTNLSRLGDLVTAAGNGGAVQRRPPLWLAALPLAVSGRDGSPVRVVAGIDGTATRR